MSGPRTVVVTGIMREQRGRNAAKVQDQNGDVHVMPVAIFDDWRAKLASGRYRPSDAFVFIQERQRTALISGWYTVQIVSVDDAIEPAQGRMSEQLERDGLYGAR